MKRRQEKGREGKRERGIESGRKGRVRLQRRSYGEKRLRKGVHSSRISITALASIQM